ncbi:MAG TPA: choice-of-anchor D domain-containing protein, partial [Glaciihabitans sp.]|nr:choice-of-anchor D domain-containing protein [Glaciihabitans sp.]
MVVRSLLQYRFKSFALLICCALTWPYSTSAQLAVAGQTSGPKVTVVDLSNPAAPVLRGSVLTILTGISSIAIDPTGSRAVAGELNGCRIAIISITNPDVPVQTGSICTTFAGVSSVAVSGTRVVVGQALGPGIELYDISGATPVIIGAKVNTVLTGVVSVAASGTCAIAGEYQGNRVVGINIGGAAPTVAGAAVNLGFLGISSVGLSGTRGIAGQQNGPSVQGVTTSACAVTLGTQLIVPNMAGIAAVSVSGTRALVGEYQGPDVAVINIAGAPALVGATMNSAFSGVSSVAANGGLGIVGQQFGPGVRAITGVNAAAPALGGSVLTTMAGISSVAFTSFSPPRIVLPSTTMAFGNVLIGASKVLALTIQNTGGSALNLSSIASSSSRFTVPATTFSVAANSTGTLMVTCSPTVAGPLSANLTANTNDPLTTSITVSLTCTGTQPPPMVVVPATLPFNVVRVGTPKSLGLSVQNAGGQPLQLTNIASSIAQFAPGVTSLTVNGGLTGNVQITFTPDAETGFNGSLTANTNDPMKPTISVALTGTGGLPHIQAPTSLAVGTAAVGCQPAVQTLTVSNTGAAQLNVSAINLSSTV